MSITNEITHDESQEEQVLKGIPSHPVCISNIIYKGFEAHWHVFISLAVYDTLNSSRLAALQEITPHLLVEHYVASRRAYVCGVT